MNPGHAINRADLFLESFSRLFALRSSVTNGAVEALCGGGADGQAQSGGLLLATERLFGYRDRGLAVRPHDGQSERSVSGHRLTGGAEAAPLRSDEDGPDLEGLPLCF